MTCVEFQQALPEILEGLRSAEQTAHLKSCSDCSALVADLNFISAQAPLLQATDEPSPRVWNSLEIALRREGLIRQPQRDRVSVIASRRGWRPVWTLAPIAAVLLVGLVVYQRMTVKPELATINVPVVAEKGAMHPGAEDEQLLEAVAAHSPAMRETYRTNLRDVNAYIRDAEETAQKNPNDEDAQRSLIDAYDQRALVYEMAFDRSLQ